ncbi:MAG: radical SAM family heme chaperone HemW [Clostridiaceae bacterium]|jgi:oxygen-independent coproporphyrinogen-3 oxidase|nr:radical SAM family heme chaperone HemW [Bacillota bacterium]NLN52228.1 radical SAM family heme chaperone HemW [Clostridiaceae bacterium]
MKDFANSNSFSGSNPNISDPIESLYIHVPFCTRKCGYCDYYSINSELANFDQYLSGIELELKAILVEIAKNDLQLNKLKTLYIGGGTPSALPPDVMTSIIDLIKREIGFTDVLEFTIEVNPEPVGHQTVLAAIENGANRISLGYQAKQDHLLETIGRLHTNIDFLETLRLIRVYGINNISCDLMFGLPDQRLNDVLQSAKQLIELDIPHISFYSLILEPGTLFYHKYNKRPDLLPAEEVERAMYHSLLKFFQQNGYDYYELSSCSKPGFYSQHNYNYWTTKPYLALGPSAHSYYNGTRKGNARSINKWLADPEKNAEYEKIDLFQAMQEYVMLAFRLSEGFSPQKFNRRFGQEHPFTSELDHLLKQGLIYFDPIRMSYRLTERGLDFANQVFIEFV